MNLSGGQFRRYRKVGRITGKLNLILLEIFGIFPKQPLHIRDYSCIMFTKDTIKTGDENECRSPCCDNQYYSSMGS